ncbi:MAG: hypothetical protein KW788_02420 [Candidatus Doudnabacteria bacterium]|nr:hypothetical protein [Candidatus Doudnabacteria bacterium]
MLEQLRRRFGQRTSSTTSTSIDWASIIYSYVDHLYGKSYSTRREDRARKECEDRGLAFGSVRILGGGHGSIKIGPLEECRANITRIVDILQTTIRERGFEDHLAVRQNAFGVEVIVTKEHEHLKAIGCCNFEGKWSQFLSVSSWEGGQIREMETYCEEGLSVLLQLSQTLGFPPGPKHYSSESPVPIEEIVIYAVRWEDPQSGCRYLDVLFRPELIKRHVYIGSHRRDDRKEGAFKGEVMACTGGMDWWPKMSINNRPVYSTIVQTPTGPMLQAKEKFAREAVRVCGVCGKLATHEIVLVHSEIGDDFGSSSHGGICYSCADQACQDHLKNQECIRAEVHPYRQEVWA